MSTLKTRIILGTVMFAIFSAVLYVDVLFQTDIGFGSLAVFAGIISLYEFYNIAHVNGFSPFRLSGIGIGAWMFVSYWFEVRNNPGVGHHFLEQKVFLILIFWLLLIQTFTRSSRDAIKNISVTIFGILYVFFLLSFAISLRHLSNGMYILIMVLLLSKFGDVGGYLLGRKFGKRKLAKVISPNKTVEGVIFSLIFSISIAVIFSIIPQIKIMSLPWAVLFGLVVGFSAIMGDLVESLMKRDADVKDAGKIIPAFGGVLDVIDCLLVSMPVAYYFLVFFKLV